MAGAASGDQVEVEIPLRLRHQLSVNENTREKWYEIFQKIDSNGDGRISYKELKKRLKEIDHDIPSNMVRRILKRGDADENGYLDFEEFFNIVKENKEIRGLFTQSMDRWIHTVCVIPKKADVDDTDAEYEEEYSCCPPPLFMIAISLLEIAAFAYDAAIRAPDQPYTNTELASIFIYDPHRRKEAWRFLTYMFVHIGIFHLIVNLLVQIMLGIPLEMVHHWWRVLLVYLAGVVAGSLWTSVSDPSVYLAGASGGVYAVIAAHVATIILNWSEMRFAAIQLAVFILLAGVDIGTAVYNRYILNDENDRVGYVAHLAGAIAGLLVGLNVLKNLEVRSWEKKLWWAAIVLFITLMLVAIVWNAAFPSYFPNQTV